MRNWVSKKLNLELKAPKSFSCDLCEKPLRCCDFTPFVPNFLVGQILRSDAAGEMFKVDSGRFTPLGLFPEPKKEICDFFDFKSKACKVWASRPSECASYYCEKFEDLNVFKDQSRWLFDVELGLAQWALLERGFSHKEVEIEIDHWNLWQSEMKHNSSSEVVLKVWPNWVPEKFEFFLQCGDWFDALKGRELRDLFPVEMREAFDKHLEGFYGDPHL